MTLNLQRSFNAISIARHENIKPGEVVYIKPITFKWGTPTLYAVLDRLTGKQTPCEIDGNEFSNRFRRC